MEGPLGLSWRLPCAVGAEACGSCGTVRLMASRHERLLSYVCKPPEGGPREGVESYSRAITSPRSDGTMFELRL